MKDAVDPETIRVAQRFVALMASRYPFVEALLYGSRARGDAEADSDVDLAFVMDGRPEDVRAAGSEMAGDAFDYLLETGFYISPFTVSSAHWQQPDGFSNPYLLKNIRRDGIPQ